MEFVIATAYLLGAILFSVSVYFGIINHQKYSESFDQLERIKERYDMLLNKNFDRSSPFKSDLEELKLKDDFNAGT